MKNMCNTLEDIIDKRLCHGCGICEAVCPQDAIQMVYDKRHMNYVPIVAREKCSKCGLCIDVCPGGKVNFAEISKKFLDEEKYDILAGHYIKNYLAWATDKDIRWRAASGGVATALSKFLLSSGRVNKVVVVTSESGSGCLDFKGTVISDEVDLCKAMGSKYCSVPLCSVLKEVQRNDQIAVFGLPCHIHGIRKAQLFSKSFGKLDTLLIGIFCGGTRGKEATKWLLKRAGLDPDKLNSINFRGNGWPGKLVARFSDGNKLTLPYPDYSSLQFNGFRPWRCSLCSDGLAELADLSIGDAWLEECTSRDDPGTSMVVTRNKKAEKLLQDAISGGVLECKIVKDNDAVRSQHNLLLRKKHAIAGSMILSKMIGRGIPQYDNIEKKKCLYEIISQLREEFLYFIGRFTAKHKLSYKIYKIVHSLQKKILPKPNNI